MASDLCLFNIESLICLIILKIPRSYEKQNYHSTGIICQNWKKQSNPCSWKSFLRKRKLLSRQFLGVLPKTTAETLSWKNMVVSVGSYWDTRWFISIFWYLRLGVKKLWHIYTMKYYVRHKKEWNSGICKDVDGPINCHTEWSNSEREKSRIISLICRI